MNRNDKIQALQARLDTLTKPPTITEQLVKEELGKMLDTIRTDVGNRVSTRAIEELQKQVSAFSNLNLDPIYASLDKATAENKKALQAVQKSFEKRIADVLARKDAKEDARFRSDITAQIASIRTSFEQELQPLFVRDSLLASEIDRISQEIRRITLLSSEDEATDAEQTQQIQKSIQDLEKRMMSRISGLNHGDHANRNIAIGGNTSVLSKYTDINFKAGANVTLTAIANTTTKYTDITITSSGGGGGGSGYQAPLSGGLTGTNTWATAPNVLVIDGISYQQTQTDTTVMWTGTTTTVLTGAPLPNFDIFASA